ncbi:MAG TPA: glycosyltransferase [Terriglobales bacterium]|nr:glycosyltransferase [Terriglobales bacterium]
MDAKPAPENVSSDPAPVVSVIVPARNEEACIADCLRSLQEQTGIDYEIIVVNDNSTDCTREIARSLGGVKVIDAPPLPPGWAGKNHAVHVGAQAARGKWLLFTDADTIHRHHSLRHALREAEEYEVDLLSYSPKQEVHGLWERALMPVIFAELRRQYPPREVSRADSPVAAANGQYLFIKREVYEAIGGHAAIRDSLLEDVEIARRLKKAGYRMRFRYGRDALKTRMYRTFPQMWEGWTKNLALLFPSPGKLASTRAGEFLLSFVGLITFLMGLVFSNWIVAIIGALVSFPVTFLYFHRIRKAHFGWINTIISPAGLPIFVLLLVNSRLHYKRNQVTWKGREYAPATTMERTSEPNGKATVSYR